MSCKTLHLRAEAAPFGTRAIITPESAKQLISDGYDVHIERSSVRFFSDDEYEAAGATLVPTGSWVSAPRDHLILGMKGIPMHDFPLEHVHVHAAHAYRTRAAQRCSRRRSETSPQARPLLAACPPSSSSAPTAPLASVPLRSLPTSASPLPT